MPFFPMHTRSVEIAMLALNFALGLFILLKFQKIDRPLNWKTDGVFFLIPIVLHLYDIIIAFALKIQIACVPAIVVSMVHIGYLFSIYLAGKKLEGRKVEKRLPYKAHKRGSENYGMIFGIQNDSRLDFYWELGGF